MLKSGLALAASALALLLISSVLDAAEAQYNRSGGARSGARVLHGGGHARNFSGRAFSGPRVYSGPAFGGHRHAGRHVHRHRFGRRFGPGIVVGVPLAAYGAYAYSASCDWLHRKAVITGSPYWWYRFEACLDGGY